MLGRISRGIGHKSSGKKGVKYRFDVVIEKLDNLPSAVKKCRVVWSRGPKLQMTEVKDVNKGAVLYKSKLSQIATMYRDAKGGFEPKEYKFQVQVPSKEDNKLLTVGRADLDMSQYVAAEGTAHSKMIPIMFKVGMASTGYLKVTITSEEVASGGDSDDGMTEVSAMTGMTANLGEDQDLSGFDEDKSAQASTEPHGAASSRPSSRLSTAALSPRKPEAKPAAGGAAPAAATTSISSLAASMAKPAVKAAVKAGDADDEISPMILSPDGSQPSSPRESNGSKSARAAGKPSIVSKAAPAAAADARAQLFGSTSSRPAKPAASITSTNSSKPEQDLTEDEARAALFGVSSSSKRSSTMQQVPASSSKPPQAPSNPAKAAAAKATTSEAASGSMTAVRRGLLDRSALQDKQQAQAATSTSDVDPSSSSSRSKQPPGSAQGHSLSDSDDDSSIAEQPSPQDTSKQRPGGKAAPAMASAAATAAATAASKTKQQPAQPPQQQQQPAQGLADPTSVTAKVLSLENEKLKAQLVALRQQAAEAEESRRMAVLAADNAASERDEYRSQVQELQEQLKEALVMTAEEGEQLKQEVQQLTDDLAKQKGQHQEELDDLRQQLAAQQESMQQHEAAAAAWEAERVQLQQQVQQAEAAAAQAQDNAAKQLQQLQADAASHEGIVRHLSWRLEAAQQALQAKQQAEKEQQEDPQSAAAASSSPGDAPSTQAQQLAAAQDKASSAERQCGMALQLLADEANSLSQHGLVHQCITDQVLEAAASTVAALGLDGGVQGPVLEVLGSLRAAAAAVERQGAMLAASQDSVQQLNMAVTDAQLSAGAFKQQHADAVADALQLQHEVAELRELQIQNEQLLKQAAQQVTTPQGDWPQQGPGQKSTVVPASTTGSPPSSTAAKAVACKACGDLQQQLSTAQHKVSKLTAARDKLEIILHDLETTAAEEQQSLEHQLSAANQALRSTSQHLAAVQQQLTCMQQEVADMRQELQVAKQQEADSASKLLQADSAAAPAAPAADACTPSSAQVIALAESAGPSGVEQALSAAQEQVADLQRQLAEAEAVRRRLDKDLASARKQLADEQSERNTLEEHMMGRLEDVGDDVAQETVAAYEVKYNRLKTRYRELTELHREEVDKLHDEIAALQERVVELEALAAQLEADKAQAQHGEVTLADMLAKASKASSELATLRSEHQMMMQALVTAKLELAQCSEREVISRHELYKARETNLKLASKMTKLETLVYANKK